MVLLFCAPKRDELLKMEKALFPLKIRLKKIEKKDYNQPLGALAGVRDIPRVSGEYTGEELSDTLLVFAGMSRSRLDQVLAALRRCGAGPFPYKAVLTDTNQYWNAVDCFEEIRKEHEAMHS